MDWYAVFLAIFGAVVLLTAWLPLLLKELPLSLPMVCIGTGVLLTWSPLLPNDWVNPLENRYITERMTEFVVIVSLMGAGLKLDRPIGWRNWGMTWRLLFIAMPITIAGVALLGWAVLGLGIAAALLLGAALAPTDPVLASDVQVGPPQSGEEDEVRFALTSEAGLNDGAAFPFVYLAIAIALSQVSGEPFFADWLLVDVIWKVGAGVAIGWIGGWVMGHLTFRLPNRAALAKSNDGFAALGITCLAYGTTELANGYGFLAVFVAAVAFRAVERRHRYHRNLHSFAEQIERLVMMVLLVCFGAAIAEGTIFNALSWPVILVAVLILLVLRPLSGWISLAGHPAPYHERLAISFFGIRGLGSFYYVAYALGQAEFDEAQVIWVTVCCVVLVSIVIHGIAVTPIMSRLDRYRTSTRSATGSPRRRPPAIGRTGP
ncbi:cation:proton antiporter [Chelativorans sp. M5D2P16]|uniref:cation:proton antiporter n=1 Tax=Chelativorans sp. M5D2P16 TaxID=3095678 RepID=UPI002ACA90D0|nr:cation:proton antiporter [Chelativorans sp. M5D2P16]MDZ5697893.1 cation:proton antiporter [Chelativorans sp. M5D2P16]